MFLYILCLTTFLQTSIPSIIKQVIKYHKWSATWSLLYGLTLIYRKITLSATVP